MSFDWPNDQLESLHSCNIIEGMFAQHVLESSFVQENPDLLEKANKLHEALADMYQQIGQLPQTSPQTL